MAERKKRKRRRDDLVPVPGGRRVKLSALRRFVPDEADPGGKNQPVDENAYLARVYVKVDGEDSGSADFHREPLRFLRRNVARLNPFRHN